MEKIVTVYSDTAMFKGGPQTRTKLTIDYSDLTDDEVRYYADDSCIIKVQNSWRRKKNSKIPTEFTYRVPKPGTRAAAVMSDEEMFRALAKKYTPEQFEAEIKRRMVGALEDKDPEDDPEMLIEK